MVHPLFLSSPLSPTLLPPTHATRNAVTSPRLLLEFEAIFATASHTSVSLSPSLLSVLSLFSLSSLFLFSSLCPRSFPFDLLWLIWLGLAWSDLVGFCLVWCLCRWMLDVVGHTAINQTENGGSRKWDKEGDVESVPARFLIVYLIATNMAGLGHPSCLSYLSYLSICL